jgi:hypothetical protein
MYGSLASTHINLGTTSTTSTSGQDYAFCTVGGGSDNTASAHYATVGGGSDNTASAHYATVGGGYGNTASGYAATVGGGYDNTASGDYSFAAGHQAMADHDGSFVWGDYTSADVNSPANNTFTVRASGGVWFGTTSDPNVSDGFINTSTGAYLSAGGTWTDSSDRDKKENITPVDGQEVLQKLAQVPISTWNYRAEDPAVRHIGPMAQDLYAAFELGNNSRSIATVDSGGISFAAIQGLYQIVQKKDAEITALNARLTAMEATVAKLLREQKGDIK